MQVHRTFGSASGSLTRFFKERSAAAALLPQQPVKLKSHAAGSFLPDLLQPDASAPPEKQRLGLHQVVKVVPKGVYDNNVIYIHSQPHRILGNFFSEVLN